MASTSSGQGSTSGAAAQEFRVRVPKTVKKKYSVLKFNKANNVDFKTCGSAKMERENNLKDYKLSHDLDLAPKFGAGSEFGKDQREEARRKKYGIYLKKYNPEDQPWMLKFGSGKQTRKFKGMKEGGILENASYYIFTQCPDGAFEAFPIEEWYNFTPVIKYKYLNSEEAEEEFNRRDKTMNYFNIMLKKRIRNDDEEIEVKKAAGEAGKKQKKKKKDFMISDMDDWADISSDEELSESAEDDDDEEKSKKKKPKDKTEKKKRKTKTNDNDEAVEESDDTNEGEEVDYMSDVSDDADPYEDERDKGDEPDPYDEKGVEEEGILDSEEEEEAQEEKKPEEKEEDGKEIKDKDKEKKEVAGSDSESSSGSESESDPEQDTNFKSALFMQKRNDKSDKKKMLSRRSSASSEGSAATNSRSATPTVLAESDPTVKRKKADSDAPTAKRPRLEPSSSISSDGISEEAVERYLMRKPMTTKDLLQKFKSKNIGLNKEKLVTTIAQILKKLNPEKTLIKDKLYLSIKKTH